MQYTEDGFFRSDNEPMSEDSLRRVAPSIFAEAPHESRSDRYCYIPTVQVIEAIEEHTVLDVVGAKEAKARDASKKGYTKHVVRFRRREDIGKQEAFELMLMNSHDGNCAYRLYHAYYRKVCSNGLVLPEYYSGVHVRHTGDVLDDVVDGTFEVIKDVDKIAGRVDEMKQIDVKNDEAIAYASAALGLRYDDPDAAPVTPAKLLENRRPYDIPSDLWTRFNVVQENLIKGGQRRRVQDSSARWRTKTARPIKGIDQNTKLNQALWELTEKMAELKEAA